MRLLDSSEVCCRSAKEVKVVARLHQRSPLSLFLFALVFNMLINSCYGASSGAVDRVGAPYTEVTDLNKRPLHLYSPSFREYC